MRPDRGTARTDVSVAFLEHLFCGLPLVPYLSGLRLVICVKGTSLRLVFCLFANLLIWRVLEKDA